MKPRLVTAMLVVCACFVFGTESNAQTRGIVCGDPTAKCRTRENFQAYELPFDFGKSTVISRSLPFYAVILKSVKLKTDQSDCSDAISESDRTDTQALFPRNM